MSLFLLPDLGEGLQEAEIVAWHVGEGDRVVTDQPLVSVETDKAVVDIPAPHSGRIARLLAKAGQRVAVGAALVEFAELSAPDAGAVVGSLEAPAAAQRSGVRAAPAARSLAQRLGVDLAAVPGSGPHGLVTMADVERAAGGGPSELSGVRRAMAQRMATAQAVVVPASIGEWADIDHWADRHRDITLRLARAIATACTAEPALNAFFDGDRLTRRLNARINLGIATDTPDGLIVPVLENVGDREPEDLRRGLDRLKADVHARKVPPEHLRGQTITLSNFGMMTGCFAQMVVVPPQVAIVGAGRLRAQPVAVDGQVVIRRRLPLSLTFDHRAVSGGEAARFLAALIADLEG